MTTTPVALVTGGNGFLGRHLARSLAGAGWRVVGLGHGDISEETAKGLGFARWINGNVDEAGLSLAVRGEAPVQRIFHAAGGASVGQSWADPRLDFERTVVSAMAVIDFARRQAPDAILVYPSSAAVYGDSWLSPIPESAPSNPVSPYGVHKRQAEELFLTAERFHGLRAGIIRYFSLYGPGLRKQLLWDIAVRLSRRPRELTLMGTGRELRDFLHVDDAVDLALRVGEAAERGSIVCNGGTGRGTSVARMAALALATSVSRAELRFSGIAPPGDPFSLVADIRAATEIGAFARRTIEEGIEEYTAWARQQLCSSDA